MGHNTEAQSLAEEIGSYRLAICCVVWDDILRKIQHVNQLLQSVSMQIDVAQVSARDLCELMNVETVLKQKRLRRTKRQLIYECPDEPHDDALKQMEVSFFNVVVDAALSSLQERFKTLGDVGEKFGVLTNFPNLSKEELAKECGALSHTLSYGGQSGLDLV